jgi:hypothetical protein
MPLTSLAAMASVGGEVRPVGVDVLRPPGTSKAGKPDSLGRGARVGDHTPARPGPPQAPEGRERATGMPRQRLRDGTRDPTCAGQPSRARDEGADVVVDHGVAGQPRHQHHLVSGGEQRVDLGDDEGFSRAERQPLGDVDDLHVEARTAVNSGRTASR